MGKILITMPDDMIKALQEIARKEDRVVAAIVRRLVAEYLLKEYGIEIESYMQRGGYRGRDSESDTPD